MCSLFRSAALLAAALPLTASVLRVCADPNNLPFSNARLQGFENRIASIVARELGARVEYFWWAQRRGFVRNTLNAQQCDVILGMASGVDSVLVTRPYYRSTYVFVHRPGFRVASFDDAVLRKARIGVQLVGDDYANTPPAHALSRRGIIRNVAGYGVMSDYALDSPPSAVMHAVARGEVDVAVVWGPLAGYFARRLRTPLELTPVSPQVDMPFLPFVYDISMAVRRGDFELKEKLERVLDLRRAEINRLLRSYGVPAL